jgi:twitching motility protein PilT
MIGHINEMRHRRIVTIEDPIEFVHQDNKCFITYREVGSDTESFSAALSHALRQDPDVILVGEMRDLETASTALAAAETGHLVLTTLHTPSAAQAIDRIISIFPSHQQQQARMQISTTLEGVLYQTLVPRANGTGRIVATEIMIANDAIRNLIRDGKTFQMLNVMQTGSKSGMQTLDQALTELYYRGLISIEDTICACRDSESLQKTVANSGGNNIGFEMHSISPAHNAAHF